MEVRDGVVKAGTGEKNEAHVDEGVVWETVQPRRNAVRVWRTCGGTATMVAVVVDGMVLGSYQHHRILVRVAMRNQPTHVEKMKKTMAHEERKKNRERNERERRNTADDDAKTHATVSYGNARTNTRANAREASKP